MKEEDIRKFYSYNEKRYTSFSHEVESLLIKLFKKNNIECDHIEQRVKNIDRVIDKIHKRKYSNPFSEMTDIIGLRIIVHYKNEVEVIRELVSEEFHIIDEIDKASELDSDKFGYCDLHLIVKLNDRRINLSEYNDYKDLQAEIQIRTILQHAWDKLSRQIEYNSKIESPIPLRRKIARLSALMEIADDEFINIKSIKDNIIKDYNKAIANDKLDIPLDYESLRIYFTKYFNVDNFIKIITDQIVDYHGTIHSTPHIDTKYFNDFLFSLKKIDFKTLKDLDLWIKKLETEELRIYLLPSLFKHLKKGASVSFDIIHYLFYQLHSEFFQKENWIVGMSWTEV